MFPSPFPRGGFRCPLVEAGLVRTRHPNRYAPRLLGSLPARVPVLFHPEVEL
jgi:hypothetical protein